MWGHVDDRLAAFCEGALSGTEARSVAAHLAGCRRCERRREETERGLALVRSLAAAALPEDRAERIRRALAEPAAGLPTSPRLGRRPRALVLAGAAALLLAAAGAFVRQRAPVLSVEPAGEPLTDFEQTAAALQRQAVQGTLPMDLTSDSPAAVRHWVQERTGLGTNLALQRPGEDAGRFQLMGAREVAVAGTRAVAVAYRIDARPAVLLTARAGDVVDRPRAWSLAGKSVRHHVDPASGVKLLSWTNSGQIYTLATELPGLGLESCFICHTDADRRRLIRAIERPPAPPP